MTRACGDIRHRQLGCGRLAMRSICFSPLPLTLVALALITPFEVGGQSHLDGVRPGLVLSQVEALPLPDTFFVRGAAVHEGGLTVLWSAGAPPQVMVADAQYILGPWNIGVQQPILSAALLNDSTVELLTPTSLVTASISTSSGVITRERILSGRAIAGVYAPIGWLILRSCGAEVCLSALDGQVLWRDLGSSLANWHVQYAAEADVVILAQQRAPFRVILVDIASKSSEEWLGHQTRIAAAAQDHGITTIADWIALPTIDVGDRFLQTFADPNSDRRLVIIYERDASYVQSTLLLAPIGFYATVPDTQQLLAFRRLNTLALVRYAWRWSRTPNF